MLPWSIGGVTDLPPSAKLGKMQQNTDQLVQLIGAATPDVPNQNPMPQPSKQLINACPIPPVHLIVTLLAGCQSAILLSNEWHDDMNPALINIIMAPNFKIKEITSGTRKSIPIPNQNISYCPVGQKANPNNVAQHINGNSHLVNILNRNVLFCLLGGPKEGGNATSPLHSWGSSNKKKDKTRNGNLTPAFSGAQKRAEMLCYPCILRDPQTKKNKFRIGCLTLAFSGAQKMAEMLRHPCIHGDPQTKRDEIRIGYLTPSFSGAQKRVEMLPHLCILRGPQQNGQNQISKPTLTVTMMPVVSQSMGL